MRTGTQLYPNAEVGEAVTEYSIVESTALNDTITTHRKESLEFCERENQLALMMINTSQAQFMLFIAKMHGVKRVLEIGVFTGYSALVWAEAVKEYPDGEVVALDVPYISTDYARETFKKTGTDKIIKLIVGDAHKTIQTVEGPFDLVFIDADKSGYVDYLEKILDQNLLSPNAIVIADNALGFGLVADASERNPLSGNQHLAESAKEINAFNKFVSAHPRLENVILPAFDGLNMIRFK